jgi:chemotaxis protein methyltransferase CheR
MKKELSKADFDTFCRYIENRTGIYIEDGKQNALRMCLDSRMKSLGVTDYDEYYSRILDVLSGEKEFGELLNLVLIKETFFFRDQRQLSALTKNILPELIKKKKGEEIKIWSAGCATGEEPYSLAMAVLEAFHPGEIRFSVYATDISGEALRKAKEGMYGKGSMRSTDGTMVSKYFTQKDGRYYLCDSVKQYVRFDSVNLVEPLLPQKKEGFDVIFCRNVIIYFRLETVRDIIQKFYDILAPDGCLFLGHSESLWQISDKFSLEEVAGVFFYRKNDGCGVSPPVSISNVAGIRQRNSSTFADKGKQVAASVPRREGGRPFLRDTGRTIIVTRSRPVSLYPVSGRKVEEGETVSGVPGTSCLAQKGVHPAEAENYEEMLNDVEEMLQVDSGNINAHVMAGRLYANMGLYDKALKKGEDALVINDLYADAYVLIGCVCYKIGEKEKAFSSFKKAVYLDEKSVLSHYYLGNIYKDNKRAEQAVKEYKNVIRMFGADSNDDVCMIDGVFSAKQLREICIKNIELLTK